MAHSFRQRYVRVALLAALGAASAPAFATNEAMMELLKVLRDNGTIKQDAYELIRNAAMADDEQRQASVEKEVKSRVAAAQAAPAAAGTAPAVAAGAAAPAAAGAAPGVAVAAAAPAAKKSWTDAITLKGDMRTRYDYVDQSASTNNNDRNRGRLRYRLGIIANPIDHIEVGAGLVSGNGDPRSGNQSFGDTFSSKQINLDYAYAQYTTNLLGGTVGAIGGKFQPKGYLWAPTDVMWDNDINPEGVSLRYTGNDALGKFFAQGGVWVVNEANIKTTTPAKTTNYDPYIAYLQLGQNWKSGDMFANVAVTAYEFLDMRKHDQSDVRRASITARNTDNKLNSFNLAGEFGTKVGPGTASVLGEVIKNYETRSSQDTAWSAGAKYAWDKWTLRYLYAQVDLNAVPDWLPDSDRFEGFTGIHGHEFEVSYQILKNVALALDYYHVRDELKDVNQNRLQADISVKF